MVMHSCFGKVMSSPTMPPMLALASLHRSYVRLRRKASTRLIAKLVIRKPLNKV